MPDLTVSAFFTRGTGIPATGLALADIDLYLTSQDKATGVDTVIWDGTQNATEEIDNVGAYTRIYALADFTANNYFARATYTGIVVLDVDHVQGATEQIDPWVYTLTTYIVGQAGYILARLCACVINGMMAIAPIRRAIRSIDLELYRGDTWEQPIARIGDISTATDIWFTAKRDKDNADAQADILISETVGLEVINQAAALVPGNGSITVTDATAGNITVRLEAVEAAKVTDKKSHWYYDVQWTDGTSVYSPRAGRLTVTGDVTRAVP